MALITRKDLRNKPSILDDFSQTNQTLRLVKIISIGILALGVFVVIFIVIDILLPVANSIQTNAISGNANSLAKKSAIVITCIPKNEICRNVFTEGWWYDATSNTCIQPLESCGGSSYLTKETCEKSCIKS